MRRRRSIFDIFDELIRELDRQKLASINVCLKYAKMRGLPHSNDLDTWMRGELWAGVTPSGRSPVICTPMKWGAEGGENQGQRGSYKTI